MAEFSIKRDPDEAFPFGCGLVLTAGQDSQKNHSIGILRDDDDVFPFRNTARFDLQEAYISGRVPIGNGPVLKAGKFVTLLGYEVIESPNNLNFSRGYLFSLADPAHHDRRARLLHVHGLAQRAGGAGARLGPLQERQFRAVGHRPDRVHADEGLSTALNCIVGPEISGDKNPIRWVVDLTANYTGTRNFTLRLQLRLRLAGRTTCFSASQDLGNRIAQWYGIAAYAAYDFLKDFRVALRQEWFNDVDGVRTGTVGGVTLFSTTATLQYNIWKGLYARGEYRHDNANEAEFGCRPATACMKKSQDTISVSLYYKFF